MSYALRSVIMKIQFENKKLSGIKADCEVVFVIDKKLDERWDKKDGADLKLLGFKGKPGETALIIEKKRLYVGVASLEHDELREAAAVAVKELASRSFSSLKIGLYSGKDASGGAKALAEGFILGAYNFQQYKSKPEKTAMQKAIISSEDYGGRMIDAKMLKKAVEESILVADAVNFTRDVVNQIPADMTPLKLSAIAKDLAKKNKLGVNVYGEEYLKKAGMNAILAVGKASPYPAQLIHLVYKAKKPKFRIALVGKGLTYDSGGLSLKPSQSMLTMKCDKSGASAVLGVMKAVSELGLGIEVHGIIGAVENMIGQHAYKPDDVLKAKNGKTIEVRNTDAEGRLVLADCLCYAEDLKPDYIIDIATLTGACMVALGEYTIGVMGHNAELKDSMEQAGEKSGELTAILPFNRYLKKLLKSDVADISNISSSSFGGAITAALFLSEFVSEKTREKWLHLDIAGPAYKEKAWGYHPYGASGAGVRLLIEWLRMKAGN